MQIYVAVDKSVFTANLTAGLQIAAGAEDPRLVAELACSPALSPGDAAMVLLRHSRPTFSALFGALNPGLA